MDRALCPKSDLRQSTLIGNQFGCFASEAESRIPSCVLERGKAYFESDGCVRSLCEPRNGSSHNI